MKVEHATPNRYQDIAYVLHSRAYQNTSLIVDVFTRQYGRIGLVAKGAKRPGSKMYGVLQPLQCLFLSWGGRGELKTLYSAELEANKSPLLSGERIYLGMYINELLVKLLHHAEAHLQIFDAYQQCLHSLAIETDCEPILRYFELRLLEELGYGVNLEFDYMNDTEIESDVVYIYTPERGFTNKANHHEDGICIHGHTIKGLFNRDLADDSQKSEAKRLLRTIIEYHLEGQPIKTRELLQQKQRYQQSRKDGQKNQQ